LTVFCGKALKGAEVLQLCGTNVSEDADGWLRDLAELANFAGVVAGQFKHGVFVAFFQASEREGQTERVVGCGGNARLELSGQLVSQVPDGAAAEPGQAGQPGDALSGHHPVDQVKRVGIAQVG